MFCRKDVATGKALIFWHHIKHFVDLLISAHTASSCCFGVNRPDRRCAWRTMSLLQLFTCRRLWLSPTKASNVKARHVLRIAFPTGKTLKLCSEHFMKRLSCIGLAHICTHLCSQLKLIFSAGPAGLTWAKYTIYIQEFACLGACFKMQSWVQKL